MESIESFRRSCATKWTILFMGCIQNLGGMSPMAIGSTAQDMKNTYNMTQEEYGLATSIYLFAEMNTLPFGPILDKFGPTVVSIISVILTVIPHAGLGILSVNEPFDHNELVIYLLFLLGGLGLAANNAAIFWTSMANFSHERHGRVVGFINGTGFFGAMIFNVVYTKYLSPNLSGYFTMVCGVTLIAFTLGIIFNVKVESVSIYEPVEFMEVKEDPKGKLELWGVENTRKPFWKSFQPYNLFILSGISYGVANAQLVWFSSQIESLGFTQYMALLLSISPVVTAIGLIIIGYVSDCLVTIYPRMTLYCIVSTMMTIIFVFSIFYLDCLAMLVALTFSNGCMIATVNCLMLAEIHKEYGEEAFGTTMGIYYLMGTIFIFVCQFAASDLYERELRRQGAANNVCYGHNCFDDFAIVQTCLLALCFLMALYYIYRQRYAKDKKSSTGKSSSNCYSPHSVVK